MSNTFDMLRLVHLGNEHGVGWRYMRAMQNELFGGNPDAFEPGTLIRLGEALGIPADEIRDVLATDRFADAVREESRHRHHAGRPGRALHRAGRPLRHPRRERPRSSSLKSSGTYGSRSMRKANETNNKKMPVAVEVGVDLLGDDASGRGTATP